MPLGGLAPDTRVATRLGPLPAARLLPGAEILTRDRGYCPLLWAGHGRGPNTGEAVMIPQGALGAGRPGRALWLAPLQGVLLNVPAFAPALGTAEALAPASALMSGRSVKLRGGFMQVVLPTHELILAEGAWIESLAPTQASTVIPGYGQGWAEQLDETAQTPIRPQIDRSDLALLVPGFGSAGAAA
ncbi:MAG: Hint domain-containing protein [Albidovulum sp.]